LKAGRGKKEAQAKARKTNNECKLQMLKLSESTGGEKEPQEGVTKAHQTETAMCQKGKRSGNEGNRRAYGGQRHLSVEWG